MRQACLPCCASYISACAARSGREAAFQNSSFVARYSHLLVVRLPTIPHHFLPKHDIMKQFFPAIVALLTLAACNSNPKVTPPTPQDTTGLAAFQQQRLHNISTSELDSQARVATVQPAAVRQVRTVRKSTASSASGGGGSTASSSGSGTAAAPAAAEKKGISKTAKGAIIGGVAGAAGGALINKKNRAAGAVIGGIVGAGAGAVIGNQADKRDGRH